MHNLNSANVTSPSDEPLTRSEWQPRIDPDRARTWRAGGIWTDETVSALARRLARQDPGRVTHVDGITRLTAGRLVEQAERLATSLERRGLRAGDVVAFQFPNWHEGAVIDVAASMLGLIVCPIVSIYRDNEVELILSDSRARGFFVAAEFRGFDYAAMLGRIRPRLPNLRLVVGVRVGDRDLPELPKSDRYEALVGGDVPRRAIVGEPDPDALKIVLYTSGTTGRPKAALHTHNTLARATRRMAAGCGLRDGDALLMPSPITHVTGFAFGIEQPVLCGTRAVLMERWVAQDALRLIEEEAIVGTVSATPFLQELLDAAQAAETQLPSFRFFGCGGAAVPPELIRRVRSVLPGCFAFRGYGSSEAPVATVATLGAELIDMAADTDGRVVDYELRIVDPAGRPVPDGADGEICVRGPSLFVGYADPDQNRDAFDADGFFRTGDVGRLTKDKAIVITGRIKDLINRGGEKLSAKEIEDLIHARQDVQEAAAVAMPHPRLGETVCVYVVPRPDRQITLEMIVRTMQEANVARQKFPEKLVCVTALPKTASGKVRKDLLRADILRRVEEGV